MREMSSRSAVRPNPSSRSPLASLRRFVRTPKGTVLAILLGLIAVAREGTSRHTLPIVVAALVGAVCTDVLILRWRGRWQVPRPKVPFPSGALISGLIVAMVLARPTPWSVALFTAAAAVASKHVLRTRWSNVFNPATLALILSALMVHSGQSWWGALPYDGVLGMGLVLVTGWFVARRVGKLNLVLSFLGVCLAILAFAAFVGDAAQVAQVFRAPDINALVFFACFMLTDPPTSPAPANQQVWFGSLAGAIGALIFLGWGVQWFILAGLPVANAAESWRRLAMRRPVPNRAGAFRGAGAVGRPAPTAAPATRSASARGARNSQAPSGPRGRPESLAGRSAPRLAPGRGGPVG